MNIFNHNSRIKWVLFIGAFSLIGYFLYEINHLINQLRNEEKKKIELWANTIGRKSNYVQHTEKFFQQVKEDERERVEQFIEVHKIILQQPLDKELGFYFKFISENKTIPIIITDEFNNILLSQNIDLPKDYRVLSGDMLKEFSLNPPLKYNVYGMNFILYYTETKVYSELHNILIDLSNYLLNEVTDNYVFVPAIITDTSMSIVYSSGNVLPDKLTQKNLKKTLEEMTRVNKPIKIKLSNGRNALVFYEESEILNALRYYPIFFILIFIVVFFIGYQLFSTTKRWEQNSIWIGMSKETAHQLGTPISSLLAWVEYLKLQPENIEMSNEITKDIHRLEMIANRFSKIGSQPELTKQDLIPIINQSVEYLKSRTSNKVEFILDIPQDKAIILPLNQYLIEWVIENLCKNAIDAMQGKGIFKIQLIEENRKIHLDVSDTGKGIIKKNRKKIFQAGFTTKQRGWGLGLSLAKRIIEQYHKGQIFVKQSQVGKGTTFRITFSNKDR
ncbi:MAG: HAMP domain-containing histidine kinase [Bacteroidales bacterium]|jgi:two-component sensor histidine kinase|nr:HAMP domain-containing histidine kinase [Bacteroidales bacterium]